jgi:hypothetical protein
MTGFRARNPWGAQTRPDMTKRPICRQVRIWASHRRSLSGSGVCSLSGAGRLTHPTGVPSSRRCRPAARGWFLSDETNCRHSSGTGGCQSGRPGHRIASWQIGCSSVAPCIRTPLAGTTTSPPSGTRCSSPPGKATKPEPPTKAEEPVGWVPVRARPGSSIEEDRQRRKVIVSGRLGELLHPYPADQVRGLGRGTGLRFHRSGRRQARLQPTPGPRQPAPCGMPEPACKSVISEPEPRLTHPTRPRSRVIRCSKSAGVRI